VKIIHFDHFTLSSFQPVPEFDKEKFQTGFLMVYIVVNSTRYYFSIALLEE